MSAIALIFPGQGSQEPGMGRDVAEAMPEAMDWWKKAERISGLPLRDVYWESDDAVLMADTRHLQPALTVVNVSLWMALASSVTPACAAGHSLGEYSALAAAGVLDAEAVLELVCLRGRLMAEADPDGRGGMAAVLKMPRQAVEALAVKVAEETGQVLRVANYNTPGQFVLSGDKAAVEAALPLVKEQKGRAMPLAVSGAFHSPLMAGAAAELNTTLSRLTWRKPRFAVYSNVTGQAVTDGESLKELASRQMTSSVLWIDTVANQYADGVRHWVEVGPKGVLSRMIKPIVDETGQDDIRVDSLGTFEAIESFIA
jgi:malonyl CoA-acyl carrier protein transacylase